MPNFWHKYPVHEKKNFPSCKGTNPPGDLPSSVAKVSWVEGGRGLGGMMLKTGQQTFYGNVNYACWPGRWDQGHCKPPVAIRAVVGV